MIVTCPNCATKYNLPDDKIPAGGAKVKCSKCSHVFKAELPPATPEEEVEDLLESEAPATDTQAGDDFDEAFDEAMADEKQETPADEPAEEEAPEEEPAAEEPVSEEPAAPADEDDGLGDLGDLFDDELSDDEPAEEPAAPAEDDDILGDDSDLFADDDDDILGDDDEQDDSSDDDLFADDDEEDDDDHLFEDDSHEHEDDEELDFDDELDFEEASTGGGKKSIGCLIILLVLTLGLGAAIYFKAWTLVGLDLGTYFQNVPYIGKMFMEETGGGDEAEPGESPADRVRKIELKNVKQYYVVNEKTGNLFVVEGKAVNKFATAKEQIKVEVVLYDAQGNVLDSQAFLCGNVLSQFQLQVQTRKEIEDGLSSEVGILSNNTFIRPGASSPFMAVFFTPPTNVKEFLVKVVDVSTPE